MLAGPAYCAAALLVGTATLAIINPRFTPVHLVNQSETLRVGTISRTPKADEWQFTVTQVLKGESAPACVLAIASAKEEDAEVLRKVLTQNSNVQAILFSAEGEGKKKAYLSVGGVWLEASSSDGMRWHVTAFASGLSGSWAGGTDTLVNLCRYVVADPDAEVPVSVGVSWMDDVADVGVVAGKSCGMDVVEIDHQTYLFVASEAGDRLFRARRNEEVFDDVAAAMKLDCRSKRFAWADVTGDGRVDLVTWDGQAVHTRVVAPDGTLKPAEPALDFALTEECLGLAPCALPDGTPSILVSTHDTPFLLSLKDGRWTKILLPVPESAKAVKCLSACVVADFGNDGYPDVLQPRDASGLLWRGTAEGFAPAVASNVFCRGEARTAVGDFNQDGFLDVFTSGRHAIELWENDGAGGFAAVSHASGSLSYRAPPGASDCRAVDLNHDGRPDLCMLYSDGEFAYHFSRGFRCFGEEGELRLPVRANVEEARPGQLACAVADFNVDGSLDLAVLSTNGRVTCFYSDAFSKPILRVALEKGCGGPLTVSAWQGDKIPLCVGTLPVGPSPAKVDFTPRNVGEVTLQWSRPGRAPCSRKLTLPAQSPEGSIDVTVGG